MNHAPPSYTAATIAEARAFIDGLEAETPAELTKPTGGFRHRLRSLFKIGRVDQTIYVDRLRERAKANLDGIVSMLVESRHPSERRFLRQFPIGFVCTGSPNPFPIRTPSGVPAILIDLYFTTFIEISNKISLATKGWETDEIRKVSLSNIHNLLYGDVSETSGANRFFGSMKLPGSEALEMFGKLNQNQHLFVLAHEFSHMILGHVENSSVSTRVLRSKQQTKVDEIRRNKDAEFEADAHATSWCRTIFEKAYPSLFGNDRLVEISLQCGEIFLLYCRLAEVVAKNLGLGSLGTEPSALERLDQIRRSSPVELLKGFETFYFDGIFPEMGDAAKMGGKFPFCDWYMEKAETLTAKEIVEHFASCPKCKLTFNYLGADT